MRRRQRILPGQIRNHPRQLGTLWHPRADKPSRSTAASRMSPTSSLWRQNRRITSEDMCALACTPGSFRKRSICRSRAASTRARIAALGSAADPLLMSA